MVRKPLFHNHMKTQMKLIPIALLLAAAAPAALRAQDAPAPPPIDPADTLKAVEMSAVERRPSFVDRAEVARLVEASYPGGLRDARVAGTVTVRLVVDARGRPLAPRVAEPSGNEQIDRAGVEAVLAMRFVPAELGGAPHPVWVNLPVAFVPPDVDMVEGATPGEVRAWADSAGAVAPSAVEEPAQATNPGEAIRIAREAGRELKEQRIAHVWFVVDGNGLTSGGRVTRSAGDARLDAAALRIVRRLRFTPARLHNLPVTTWMSLPFQFGRGTAAGGPTVPDPAGPDSTGAYELTSVETVPTLANRAEVVREISRVYPAALRDQGITGTVSLRFSIDTLGVPGEPVVERSTRPELASAALQVVRVMRFEPATVKGKKVRVWVSLPISFQMGVPYQDNTPPSQRRPAPGQRLDPWGNPWP